MSEIILLEKAGDTRRVSELYAQREHDDVAIAEYAVDVPVWVSFSKGSDAVQVNASRTTVCQTSVKLYVTASGRVCDADW